MNLPVRREKVLIPLNKPYITLQGEGRNRTIITWNDTAASAGTLMSATVVVESDHFIARDISFRVSAKIDGKLNLICVSTYVYYLPLVIYNHRFLSLRYVHSRASHV